MPAGPSWNDDELEGLGFTTDAAATGDGSLIAITKQLRVLLTAALTANAATSYGKTITYVSVDQTVAATTALAGASVGNKHKLVGAALVMAGAGTLKFTDGVADLCGAMSFAANGGFVLSTSIMPYLETGATNRALNLVTTGAAADGFVAILTEA